MKLEGKRILLTGSNGTLGSELVPLLKAEGAILYTPRHKEVPVDDLVFFASAAREFGPDIILHAAAYTNVPRCEVLKYRNQVIATNIYGTDNVKIAARECKAKMVYISTDYVYEGSRGGYSTKDPTHPRTFYGFSKLAGESFLSKKEDLVVRTSFIKRRSWGPARNQLSGAFEDTYTSKDWVDIVAKLIVGSIGKTGIINVGTERKSLMDLALQEYPEATPISTDSVKLGYEYPRDSSMELSI